MGWITGSDDDNWVSKGPSWRRIKEKKIFFSGDDSFEKHFRVVKAARKISKILYPNGGRKVEAHLDVKGKMEKRVDKTTLKVVIDSIDYYGEDYYYLRAVDCPSDLEDNLCADGYNEFAYYPSIESAIKQAVFLHGDSLDLKNETITLKKEVITSCTTALVVYEYC